MGMTVADRSKSIKGNNGWSNYCQNKATRQSYTYRITCTGEGYYFKGGEQLTEQQMNERFPIGLIDRSAYGHLDGRQRAMF